MNPCLGFRWALAAVLWIVAAGFVHAADGLSVELRDDGAAVDVKGLSAAASDALAHADWKPDQWAALFAVYVDKADGVEPTQRPPVLGEYRIADGVLHFTPRFPLMRGVHYQAVFHPENVPGGQKRENIIVKSLYLPKAATAPTAVEQVYPTADRLPENELKFYVHFTAPMSRGEAYRRIHLLDADGKPIDAAFLELGEELWDPDGKRFTLLIDPGRIKRGLKPREDLGPVLEQGKTYTLLIDREWADANGELLKDAFRKTIQATAADESPPDPKTWRLEAPAAGGKGPLIVKFPKPMDHALLLDMLWIMDAGGRKIAGDFAVTDGETRWRFTPREAWAAGSYRLVADARLEDLAGNTLGRPFEVDVTHPTTTEQKQETVETPFEVRR
jgi:hypothetical protein